MKVWVNPFIVTFALPAVAYVGRSTVISDGYGIATPKSGIAMGAVFENVAMPVQGGVGEASGPAGPPCMLIAREEPIAPKAATPAATKNNGQNRRRHRDGVNVRFGFVIIELPVRTGLTSRRDTEATL